jgi:hypothetical protein
MSDIREIKKEIRSLLDDDNLEPKDRLKAIECWTRIVMVEHKVSGGDTDGSFFTAPKRSRKKPP